MRLIKALLRIIGALLVLVIVAIVALLFIISDNSSSNYKPSKESFNSEAIISEGLNSSLTRIEGLSDEARKDKNYNYIGVGLDTQDLNDLLVGALKSLNKDYDGENAVLSVTGASLDSICFEEVDGNLGVKARGTALGFYHTSVTLAGTPSIDENKVINIKFTDFKVGNRIHVGRDYIFNLLNTFNIQANDIKNGDLSISFKDLSVSYDAKAMIDNAISENPLADFFKDCNYDLDYIKAEGDSLGKLALKVDTTKIFSPVKEVKQPISCDISSKIPSDPMDLLTWDKKVTLTENEFNYVIKEQLKDTINNYKKVLSFAGTDYTFTIADLYYNIESATKGNLQAVLALNGVKTNMFANCTIQVSKAGDTVDKLILSIDTIQLGETTTTIKNFFDKVEIPASTLTPTMPSPYTATVKDIVFAGGATPTVTMEYDFS